MRRTCRGLCAISICCLSLLLVTRVSAQDAAAGKQIFAQCTACHTTDGTNGVAPSLKGIAGRKAGTFAGFRYSRAMRAANMTWDDRELDAYLADPQKAIPGNVMPFSGLSDGKERADVIAYLNTLR